MIAIIICTRFFTSSSSSTSFPLLITGHSQGKLSLSLSLSLSASVTINHRWLAANRRGEVVVVVAKNRREKREEAAPKSCFKSTISNCPNTDLRKWTCQAQQQKWTHQQLTSDHQLLPSVSVSSLIKSSGPRCLGGEEGSPQFSFQCHQNAIDGQAVTFFVLLKCWLVPRSPNKQQQKTEPTTRQRRQSVSKHRLSKGKGQRKRGKEKCHNLQHKQGSWRKKGNNVSPVGQISSFQCHQTFKAKSKTTTAKIIKLQQNP